VSRAVLKPWATIGILGGGQLGRMLALAAARLGFKCHVFAPSPDSPAFDVVHRVTCADYNETEALDRFAADVDVVTYEFENVPAEGVKYLAAGKVPVYPDPQALAVSRDRLNEKTLFRELGIPTPDFAAVGSLDDLKKAAREIGLPAVLKSRTMGYDGKGQAVIRAEGDIEDAWARVGKVECILEGFVSFTREISIIAVRGRAGEVLFYPVGENTHSDGILHHNVVVNGFDDPMQKTAEDYSRRLLDYFGYVGVLSLELFDANGVLMANEIAPRVHNTGHWSIEGAETSQFENHIRAIMGLPLGDTAPVGCSAMVNFIGRIPSAESVLAIKGAHFHDYGKEPKPGRKIGHGTIRCDVREDVSVSLGKLLALV
jgi:5-(carboxyamino)imidazole ribonucleotide synthase